MGRSVEQAIANLLVAVRIVIRVRIMAVAKEMNDISAMMIQQRHSVLDMSRLALPLTIISHHNPSDDCLTRFPHRWSNLELSTAI